jgi:hypothetical protein
MSLKTKRWVLWVSKLIVLVIYLILLAYAVITGMAFFLQLLGANPTSDFADWVYRAAANITEPFRGIFPTTTISDRSEFNASYLFALLVYLVAAVLLHGLIDWLARGIAGVDRAEEREERQALLDAQQTQTRAALGLGPTPGAPTPAGPPPVTTPPSPPPAPAPEGGWNQPPSGTVSGPGPGPTPGAWTPGMPVEPPEPMLPSD